MNLKVVFTCGFVSVVAFAFVFRSGEAKSPACDPLSQSDQPRLNLRVDPVLTESISQCTLNVTAYIQSRSPVDSISGSITAIPMGAQEQTEHFMIRLDALPTGMKSGSLEFRSIPAPFCRQLSLKARIGECLTKGSAVQSCPPIRFVGAQAYDTVDIAHPTSTVCYD
jgi:hypothetical protein